MHVLRPLREREREREREERKSCYRMQFALPRLSCPLVQCGNRKPFLPSFFPSFLLTPSLSRSLARPHPAPLCSSCSIVVSTAAQPSSGLSLHRPPPPPLAYLGRRKAGRKRRDCALSALRMKLLSGFLNSNSQLAVNGVKRVSVYFRATALDNIRVSM